MSGVSAASATQPGIVTTGLLAHVDAWNGSSSSWPNKKGGAVTLVNSPSYTSSSPYYFTFTPNTGTPTSSPYATLADLGSLTNWTAEAWFTTSQSLVTNTSITTLVTSVANGSNVQWSLGTCAAGAGIVSGNAQYNIVAGFHYNTSWYCTGGFAPTLNTWYQTVGTYNGTTLTQYVNGASNSTYSITATNTGNGNGVRIGCRWDDQSIAADYWPGNIAIIRVYNNALSAAQVAQNFNAQRSRFGI